MQRVLGLSQARIAGAYSLEFAGVGAIASAAGVALGFAVHHVFVWLLAGLVNADLPTPGPWPALFGMGVGMTLLLGFGLPPVLQLARVPPLRVMRRDVGALKASSALVLAAGTAGFVALAVGGFGRPEAGPDRGGRFCRGDRAVRTAVLAGRDAAQARRARSARAALAGAGHTPDRRAAGLRGAAGVGAGGGAAGAGAAGAAAHRPDRQLAQGHAAGCAEPLRHQPAARAGRCLSQDAGRHRRQTLRLVPDDPRPAGGHQRPGGKCRRHGRRARQAAGRTRVQPQPRCAHAGAQHAQRRRMDGGGGRCDQRRGRPGRDAGREARRPPALRHRRAVARRAHHQPAQGGLVVDARQLLRHVPRGRHAGPAAELHQRVPSARDSRVSTTG